MSSPTRTGKIYLSVNFFHWHLTSGQALMSSPGIKHHLLYGLLKNNPLFSSQTLEHRGIQDPNVNFLLALEKKCEQNINQVLTTEPDKFWNPNVIITCYQKIQTLKSKFEKLNSMIIRFGNIKHLLKYVKSNIKCKLPLCFMQIQFFQFISELILHSDLLKIKNKLNQLHDCQKLIKIQIISQRGNLFRISSENYLEQV